MSTVTQQKVRKAGRTVSQTATGETKTRMVILADEKAVVTVLDILAPLSQESRALVMQAVEANLKAGYPRLQTVGTSCRVPWREVQLCS
jgi:hypothetical protein